MNCKENDKCNECKLNSHFEKDDNCICNQGYKFNKTMDRCDEIVENCEKFEMCKKCSKDKCLACKENSLLSSNSTCICSYGYKYNKNWKQITVANAFCSYLDYK